MIYILSGCFAIFCLVITILGLAGISSWSSSDIDNSKSNLGYFTLFNDNFIIAGLNFIMIFPIAIFTTYSYMAMEKSLKESTPEN
jgi:predicted MFS family arabinose efflux permease